MVEENAWVKYHQQLEEFQARMKALKPARSHYATEEEYNNAYAEWEAAMYCDGPNPPEYYRARND